MNSRVQLSTQSVQTDAATVVIELCIPVFGSVTQHHQLLQQFKIFGANENRRWPAILGDLHTFMTIVGSAHSIGGTIAEGSEGEG